MGPPKESVFDPRLVWEKERPFYLETLNTKGIATLAISSETPTKKKEKEKEKKVKEKVSEERKKTCSDDDTTH